MINNEWERFGEDIRRTIQNAVDSRNFSRLNQTVSDTIGQAMDNISGGSITGAGTDGRARPDRAGLPADPNIRHRISPDRIRAVRQTAGVTEAITEMEKRRPETAVRPFI